MSDTPARRLPPDAASGGVRTGHVDLPVVLLAALDAAGTSVDAFLARLQRGSIWQDQAIRSVDRRVVIQTILGPDGPRCVIQVGERAFYHWPASILHLVDMVLPATVMAVIDLDASILGDPLFAAPGMIVRRMKPLGRLKPEIGTAMLLQMPTVTISLR